MPVENAPRQVLVLSTKSVGLAVFLGIVFGPLGLLYSTIPGAVVMFLVNVGAGIFTLGLGLLLTWPLCGLWAFIAAKAHNAKLVAGAASY